MEEKIIICVHDGVFHADDVYASALMEIYAQENGLKFEAYRLDRHEPIPTDKNSLVETIVADMGGGEFDHHQPNAEFRPTGEKYAAFGLLWRKYWKTFFNEKRVADKFELEFIIPMDLCDNFGITRCPSSRCEDIADMNGKYISDKIEQRKRFDQARLVAKTILVAQFETRNRIACQENEAIEFTKMYPDTEIAKFDHFIPAFLFKNSNVKFVITPRDQEPGKYNLISVDSEKFKCLSKEELPDEIARECIFVHPTRFMSIFSSETFAYNAAKLAIYTMMHVVV